MTAVCALALLLAVVLGLNAARAVSSELAAVGGAAAASLAIAAVGAGLWCLRRPHPLQEKNR